MFKTSLYSAQSTYAIFDFDFWSTFNYNIRILDLKTIVRIFLRELQQEDSFNYMYFGYDCNLKT